MTPALRVRPAGSLLVGPLPTGCALCERGTKMVLFATGVCHYKCFYCPISSEKRMSGDAWVNERRVPAGDDLTALSEEARAMGARGTGITGGDPMYDPERTLRYIRFLKAEFGPKHHIHLYTQIPFDTKWVAALEEAGLDELRFHPPEEIWADIDRHPKYTTLYREAARRMRAGGPMEVGAEIPCIPATEEALWNLIRWINAEGFRFINLNELEFSETNYAGLLGRGFRIRDDTTSRVTGSEETAREVLRRTQESGLPIGVHFCSSPFKDKIQLRERLKRRAERVARAWDDVTEDGTLVRGIVRCPDPIEARNVLARDFGVPPRLTHPAGDVLYVAPGALEPIAALLPYPSHLTEIYPTHEELEVERTPLGDGTGHGTDWPSAAPRHVIRAQRPGGWA
ncbi:MAG: radical SAM protein [Thermoplasmatota archaeon]